MDKKGIYVVIPEQLDRKLEFFSYKLDQRKSSLVELALRVLFEVLEDRADCIVTDADLDQVLQRLKERVVPEAEAEVV